MDGTVSSQNNGYNIDGRQLVGVTTQTRSWGASTGWSEFRPVPNSSWRRVDIQKEWPDVVTPEVQDQSALEHQTSLESMLLRSGIAANLTQMNETQLYIGTEAFMVL